MKVSNKKVGLIIKSIRSLICMILILFIFINNSFANVNELDFYEIEKEWESGWTKEFKETYDLFVNSINHDDFLMAGGFWSRIRPANDKLIIGSSGVVYCGMIMEDDIDKFGYDVIGYGGVPDIKMKEWISNLNKKYKKIIIFSGINTLEICSLYNIEHINGSIVDAIFSTMEYIANSLLEENGTLAYVKVKEMEKDENSLGDIEYYNRINTMAKELNYFLDALPIQTIELNYPTTKEYSHGYIHYIKKDIWEDILSK